jgi:dTDP-4-amino-4,6-dideoxygalactose transaminase
MRGRYDYAMPGHNFRLSDLHAAIGIPQMRRIDATIKQRAANAAALSAGLGALAGLRVPLPAEGRTHVFHQYTVRVLDDAPVTRDELARRLTAAGVGTGVYYPRLVWDYDCFRHHPRVQQSDTPVAATAARQVLSLPVHEHLTPAEIDRIVESVSEAMDA